MIDQQLLSGFYRAACELEVQAYKPGNVSIYADGHDMCVQDFIVSATVSAESLCNPNYSLGEKIYYAVEETNRVVGCNTNLGIILLCAPLLHTASLYNAGDNFKQLLAKVLEQTTVNDACWVFKAISLASPGGIGKVDAQDISETATVTLHGSMKLASHRDRIALQYVSCFKDVFDFGVLRYNAGFNRWGKKDWAAAFVYTGLLSNYPDSHIERKYGDQYSELVAARMLLLDAALADSSKPELLKPMFAGVDREFKLKGINPGTTADLTVATLLTVTLMNFLNVK